ncbi:MAG: YlzJ-like family protein [Thermoclostridium sp.]|nr:YlzJ-like family protein [Thermoclostridium sp.]
MIYSIVPFEQILFDQQSGMETRMEVTLDGERVVLMQNDDKTYSIERLISTNPKAYLKPELTPGTILMTITAEKETPDVTWQIMNRDTTRQIK